MAKIGTTTHRSAIPQLNFDGEIYKLHLTSTAQLTQSYALKHVNRSALKLLIRPEQNESFVVAVLAPIDSGAGIGVWVQDLFIGAIKNPQVLLDSQLLRIFASGHLISCQLHLTPSQGSLASIILPELDFAVIMNEVPHAKSSLLADGELWNAEPISTSVFQGFLPKSTVLFELQEHQSVVSLLYDGVECAVLNVEDAEELSSAIRFSTVNGVLPLVRGRVSHSPAGTFIEIDALPLSKWTKTQRRLGVLTIPLLVPYQADTQLYKDSVERFSDRIIGEIAEAVSVSTFSDKAVRYGPYLTLAAGTASLVGSFPTGNIHLHHLAGYSIAGIVLITLAIGVLIARSRTDSSQLWNLFSSVGLIISVPVFVFITANTYLDATNSEITASDSTRITTLSNRPSESKSPSNIASESTFTPDRPRETSSFSLPGINGNFSSLVPDLQSNLVLSPHTRSEIVAQAPSESLNALPTPISTWTQNTSSREYGIDDEPAKTAPNRPPVSKPTIAFPPTMIAEPLPPSPTETHGETTGEASEPSENTDAPVSSLPELTPEPSETTDPAQTTMLVHQSEPTSVAETTPEPTEASVETTEASLITPASEN